MADAIIALTSNLAMKKHKRIEFKPGLVRPEKPRCGAGGGHGHYRLNK